MIFTQEIFSVLSKHARGHKGACDCMKKVEKVLHAVQVQGIRIAADVASQYDRLSTHPFLVSDCILGKLNVPGGKKPRPNKSAKLIDQAITRIERKVDSLEGTMRFMLRSAQDLSDKEAKTVRAFIREMDQKRRQNEADAKESGDKHSKGFADAQGWASRRLKEILGDA